VWLCAC